MAPCSGSKGEETVKVTCLKVVKLYVKLLLIEMVIGMSDDVGDY